ncbi:hypothetical protein Sru01_50480 [Sphaerisporangium rufum]|uniref:Uncharacterized protein n=1 Tax=Sphaerisporangium rufum TaxID=1381558 RepID=A0A919V0H0_9ACTN|nr:hypothetical protein [Sphaerisporangium rufum]GII80066.1 hypothetical protein Sru01_50480 [Sphaerisporangium rufum]
MYGYRCDDFGITQLASAHYISSWWEHYETGLDIVRELAREQNAGANQEYLFDALLLDASPLTAGQLAALWRSACDSWHHPDVDGLDGRGWLRAIIDIMTPPVRAAGLEVTPPDEIDRRPKAAERVTRAVRRFSITANFHLDPADEEYLRRAMLDLVEYGLPELAFRFFLVCAVKHWTPVDLAFIDELHETAELFEYEPYVVYRLTHILPPGEQARA